MNEGLKNCTGNSKTAQRFIYFKSTVKIIRQAQTPPYRYFISIFCPTKKYVLQKFSVPYFKHIVMLKFFFLKMALNH